MAVSTMPTSSSYANWNEITKQIIFLQLIEEEQNKVHSADGKSVSMTNLNNLTVSDNCMANVPQFIVSSVPNLYVLNVGSMCFCYCSKEQKSFVVVDCPHLRVINIGDSFQYFSVFTLHSLPLLESLSVGCRRLRDGRAGDDDERRRHARRDLLCISFARDGKCVNETMWPSMKKSFSSEMDDTWDDYNFVTVVLTKWMWGLGESFIIGRRKTRSQTPPNSLSFFQTSGNPIDSEGTL